MTGPEANAMRQAIAISALGLGGTSPNPPVGCVILTADGQIAGQGYHRRKGEAHAEVNALAAAGSRARGGTAVVTLEPCNHHGVTPPCHQALIDAGLRRVVIALIDPTSRGDGGVTRLRQAGIDVAVGVLEDEARLVLGPWLNALATHRPYLHWAHALSTGADSAGLDMVMDAADLYTAVDVVLQAEGHLREAITGRHLPGVLTLDNVTADMSAEQTAHALYAGGIRTALLDLDTRRAASFVEAGLVHRATAYTPTHDRLADGVDLAPWQLVPQGFALDSVKRVRGYLRVDSTALPIRDVLHVDPDVSGR